MVMATQLHSADTRAGVRRLVADEVSEALTRQSGLAKTAAANTAQIVAAVAAAVVGLSPAQQQRLKSKSADVADMIAAFSRAEMPAQRIVLPQQATIKRCKGSGYVALIDTREGRRTHAAPSPPLPMCEWAR